MLSTHTEKLRTLQVVILHAGQISTNQLLFQMLVQRNTIADFHILYQPSSFCFFFFQTTICFRLTFKLTIWHWQKQIQNYTLGFNACGKNLGTFLDAKILYCGKISERFHSRTRYSASTCTVPLKCKLTGSRSSILETRFSILDTRKLRGLRLESSFETFKAIREFIKSSFETFKWEKQRTFRVINFWHVWIFLYR